MGDSTTTTDNSNTTASESDSTVIFLPSNSSTSSKQRAPNKITKIINDLNSKGLFLLKLLNIGKFLFLFLIERDIDLFLVGSIETPLNTRNPVIERITGQIGNNAAASLRNESYYRVSHFFINIFMNKRQAGN